LLRQPFGRDVGSRGGYAAASFPANRPLMAGLLDLMHRIHHDFIYDPEATTVSTPLDRVLADRRGVCQDFAHLGIACLRSLGLSARYVRLSADPSPPGKRKLKGSDASQPAFRFRARLWMVDLDPTNDKIPTPSISPRPGAETITTSAL